MTIQAQPGMDEISIHALREEGDLADATSCKVSCEISIHALREEGDGWCAWHRLCQQYFYPRPPRGGRPKTISILHGRTIFLSTPSARRATPIAATSITSFKFLSTPSARRATSVPTVQCRFRPYFYPRPPRGGRPGFGWLCRCGLPISIHALREEGDSRDFC